MEVLDFAANKGLSRIVSSFPARVHRLLYRDLTILSIPR